MSCQVNAHLIVCLHCTILDSSTVSWLYAYDMQTTATCTVLVRFQVTWLYLCKLLPRVQYLWGFKSPDCMHADYCHVYSIYEVSSHLIVCMHSNCRLLPFVQYCSSINILVMYRKRSSEETDDGTSSTSEDFDKPPWKKRGLSVLWKSGYWTMTKRSTLLPG